MVDEKGDVVVVGGGTAGLSAALTLLRARRSVLVIDDGRPHNAPAAAVHGFPSREGMAPGEPLASSRDEVRAHGSHRDPFSAVSEREVSRQVLGDRRHGLPSVSVPSDEG